jgi:hypothetical protein
VLILVSGFGIAAAAVWVVLIGLGWLALVIRLVRRKR